MTALLLSPHSDDAVLFACWSLLAHRPLVVTVLASQLQEDLGMGVTHATRAAEDACAYNLLGCDHTQWPYPDSDPDWGAVENAMRTMDERLQPDRVFAPAIEPGGHGQHNAVAQAALSVFGERVIGYLTYVRGNGRSRSDREVPFEPSWPAVKLRAMACYLSQISEPSTRDWFLDGGLREWYA
jgi:LmbE family N-acetylglucosaminyl deacetylase